MMFWGYVLVILAAFISPIHAFVVQATGALRTLDSHACQSGAGSMSMAYNKVFVAGGSKGVGREIVNRLVAQGSEVVALVRREDAKAELEQLQGVKAVVADALDIKAVEGALDGCDAAISTLGGMPEGDEARRVDYAGNRNVIESAGILGVTRVILVTSLGCGSSRGAVSDKVYETLQKALVAKTKAENMLIKYYTNSEWTIVRPGGLVTDEPTGKAIVTEDVMAAGLIRRADVADLVIKVLNSSKASQKIFTAIDPSIQSQFNSESKSVQAFEL